MSSYVVKVRTPDSRRFRFVTPHDTTSALRIHAMHLTDETEARTVAESAVVRNPELVAAARVTNADTGATVARFGEPIPPSPGPLYGPENGYRYLVGVTKAGRAEFHITDDTGAWSDFDMDAYETCAAEARRAGINARGRYNVHGNRALLATVGVRFIQHAKGDPSKNNCPHAINFHHDPEEN